jgi:hypothetical protein
LTLDLRLSWRGLLYARASAWWLSSMAVTARKTV